MTQITIEKLQYDGSNFTSAVQGATNTSNPLNRVRLELTIDEYNAREPFLISAHLEGPGFGEGPWSLPIERTWHFDSTIELSVWVSPAMGTDEWKYQNIETEVGNTTISAPQTGSFELLGGDLKVPYECTDDPSEQYKEVESDDSTETRLHRTPAIESAMADFPTDDDLDGLDFLEASDVADVLDTLTSRVDTNGNGYPDGAIEIVDQANVGLCAAASLLTQFACFWPRRLIELTRSLYRPIAFDENGHRESGFLCRSTTFDATPSTLKDFYVSQVAQPGEALSEAPGEEIVPTKSIQLLLQYIFRSSLRQIPPLDQIGINVPRDQEQYRTHGIGMDAWEIAGVAKEVLGPADVYMQKHEGNALFNDGFQIIVECLEATTTGELGVLGIDSVLAEIPENASGPPELAEDPVLDHAITPLSLVQDASDYEVAFQNSWGGSADSVTVSKQQLEDLVFNVVLSGGVTPP